MNEDAELLRRYAEDRSEAAYTAWVERRFDLVYTAALRRLGGDAHRARDVAQTVFVDAARQARTLARHPAVVGWLYSSTHFAAGKLLRSEGRRAARETAAHHMQSLAAADSDPTWAALRPCLEEEMHGLGRTDRLALLLRFFEHHSWAEVGARLGVGENAARMRVERALDQLRGRLARRGVTSTAAALAAGLTAQAVTAAPAGLGAAVAHGALTQLAAVAGGGAATLFPLMASKLTVGLTAGVGLLALGSGLYYHRQAETAQRAAAVLAQSCAELTASLQAAPLAAAAAAAPAPARPGAARPAPAALAPAAVLNREIAENPQLRRALGQSFLAAYRLKYGSLARTLGLSDAQLTSLAQADLKLRSDLFDLQQAARLLGDGADQAATLDQLEQQARAGHEQMVQAQLGEARWRQFQEYDRTYAARAIANQVAAGSFFSPTPLTSPQAEVLMQLLAPAPAPDGAVAPPDAVDWDAVLAHAAGTLPPAQLAALQAVRAARERQRLADAAGTGEENP